MEKVKRKSVNDNLQKYDYLAKDYEFIEVTEWRNGEGWDISINDKIIQLTMGQLDAINYLTKALEYQIFNGSRLIRTITFTINMKWFYEGNKFFSN